MNSQATVGGAKPHGIVGLFICGFISVAGLARADVVLDWNAIMMSTVSGENGFAQTRFAAITQVAVFEAVNAITGDYEPYLGTITAPPGASAEAAAVAAAHRVLENYFPGTLRRSWCARSFGAPGTPRSRDVREPQRGAQRLPCRAG